MEIFSGQAIGGTLLVGAGLIVYGAVHRLVDPPHVRAGLVLAVALVGAAGNTAGVLALSRADLSSLNIEGSFQHILTDLYGFIGTALATRGLLIIGFQPPAPLAPLLLTALVIP